MTSESDLKVLTLEDSVEERLKSFVKHAVIFTKNEAERIIKVSLDKTKAKSMNTDTAGSVAKSAAHGLPIIKPIVGIMEKAAQKTSQKQDHKRAKKLHQPLIGLQSDNLEWTTTLVEVFTEFFIIHNLQFNHLLQNLEDSWENAMMKLAADATHRFYDYLQAEIDVSKESVTLTKALILKCFEKGSSNWEFMKMVKNLQITGQGGSIKTKNKTFITSKLFDKPVNVNKVKKDSDIDKYFYQYDFGQVAVYNFNIPKLCVLKIHDKFEYLKAKKDQLIAEIMIMVCPPKNLIASKLDQIGENVAHVEGKVGEVLEGVDKVQEDVNGVRDNMSKIQDDLGQVEDAVNVVNEEVNQIQDKMDQVKEQINGVNDSVGNMEQTIGDLDGKIDQVLDTQEDGQCIATVQANVVQPITNINLNIGVIPPQEPLKTSIDIDDEKAFACDDTAVKLRNEAQVQLMTEKVNCILEEAKIVDDKLAKLEEDLIVKMFSNLKTQVSNFRNEFKAKMDEHCPLLEEELKEFQNENDSDSNSKIKRSIKFMEILIKTCEYYLTIKEKETEKLKSLTENLEDRGLENHLQSENNFIDFSPQPPHILINLSGSGFAKKKHHLQKKIKNLKDRFEKGEDLESGSSSSDSEESDADKDMEWFENGHIKDYLQKSMLEIVLLKEQNTLSGFKSKYAFGKVSKAISADHGGKKIAPSFGDIIWLKNPDPIIVSRKLPVQPVNVTVNVREQVFTVHWLCVDNSTVPTTGKIFLNIFIQNYSYLILGTLL